MARFDAQIQAICGPFEEAVSRPDTIPGVARRTAEMIVAEIGTAMMTFPPRRPPSVLGWGRPRQP